MPNPSLKLLENDPATWPTPAAGSVYFGVTAAGELAIKQSSGAVVVIGAGTAPTFHSTTTTTTAVTVTPAAPIHTEQVIIGGTARTVPISVLTANAVAGNRVTIALVLPNSAGFTVTLSSDAGQIASFGPTDGLTLNGIWDLYFDGTNWTVASAQFSAFN